MKASAIKDLEARTLETSKEVIRDRIDKLGVSEPTDPDVRAGRQPDPGGAAGSEQSAAG